MFISHFSSYGMCVVRVRETVRVRVPHSSHASGSCLSLTANGLPALCPVLYGRLGISRQRGQWRGCDGLSKDSRCASVPETRGVSEVHARQRDTTGREYCHKILYCTQ
ncbi:unnamed protein product, partial [Discosporangium mesarthrocarpum]